MNLPYQQQNGMPTSLNVGNSFQRDNSNINSNSVCTATPCSSPYNHQRKKSPRRPNTNGGGGSGVTETNGSVSSSSAVHHHHCRHFPSSSMEVLQRQSSHGGAAIPQLRESDADILEQGICLTESDSNLSPTLSLLSSSPAALNKHSCHHVSCDNNVNNAEPLQLVSMHSSHDHHHHTAEQPLLAQHHFSQKSNETAAMLLLCPSSNTTNVACGSMEELQSVRTEDTTIVDGEQLNLSFQDMTLDELPQNIAIDVLGSPSPNTVHQLEALKVNVRPGSPHSLHVIGDCDNIGKSTLGMNEPPPKSKRFKEGKLKERQRCLSGEVFEGLDGTTHDYNAFFEPIIPDDLSKSQSSIHEMNIDTTNATVENTIRDQQQQQLIESDQHPLTKSLARKINEAAQFAEAVGEIPPTSVREIAREIVEGNSSDEDDDDDDDEDDGKEVRTSAGNERMMVMNESHRSVMLWMLVLCKSRRYILYRIMRGVSVRNCLYRHCVPMRRMSPKMT